MVDEQVLPEEQEPGIEDWNVYARYGDELISIKYTCPLDHAKWTINVALGETETELFCFNDGNKIILHL